MRLCTEPKYQILVISTMHKHSFTNFICIFLPLKFPSKSFSRIGTCIMHMPKLFQLLIPTKDRQDDAFIRLIVVYLFGKWNFSPRNSLLDERETETEKETSWIYFCLFSNVNVKGWTLMLHAKPCVHISDKREKRPMFIVHSFI